MNWKNMVIPASSNYIKLSELFDRVKERGLCMEEFPNIYEKSYNEIFITEPPKEVIDKLSKLFKILSDKQRLRILMTIVDTPLPVCAITCLLGIDQTLVSHHLKVLRNADLVDVIIKGRFRFYKAKIDQINKLLTILENTK
jgi:DNA-binding transcriptional ArsR family regulator